MKARLNFKILFLLVCLCSFTSAIVAQEKTQALKFDEFDLDEGSFYYNEPTFSERVERFAKQLQKERGVRAYVIYYQARISHENVQWKFTNQVKGIEYRLKYNDGIQIKNVAIVEGGYREKNSVEFWIVPENVELPAPTPTFDKSETFICPNIYMYNDTPPGSSETINFVAPSHNFKDIENYSLIWRVSAGEIVEGQGMDFIKVKLDDPDVKRVTAYLEVSGLPFPCPKVFSATAEVNGKLSQVDSFGIMPNGEVRARLDNFLIGLQNNPTAKGYVIIYGGRIEGNRDLARRETLIRNHFRLRNYDMSRITFVRGGFRETVAADLWLAFDDVVPTLTPTIDEKFVVAPKPKAKPRSRKK